MTLADIAERTRPPTPWAEGENLPWNDPAFSRRMLREHLSQEHGLASRRLEVIDRQVAWIHDRILHGRTNARILDLACGPGLYTSRLAGRGPTCHGIDFAPAAIQHARRTAQDEKTACTYTCADLRTAPFGTEYDLVMMLYGQFNVFRREEAADLMRRARHALRPGGILLLEPQTFDTVKSTGQAPAAWYTCGPDGDLFAPHAHICLSEAFWDEQAQTTTQRWFVLDTATGNVARYAMSTQAYREDDLRRLLKEAGFTDIRRFPSLVGVDVPDDLTQHANTVFVARTD